MSNILLVHPRPEPFSAKTVREGASGGTERAFIFLAEAFERLGHEVTIATTTEQAEAFCTQRTKLYDVAIMQTAVLFELLPKQTKKIWWSHHFTDQTVSQLNAPYARIYADSIVTLSQCHHDDIKETHKLESMVIPHGFNWEEKQTDVKDPYRLVYASAPFRGLEKIPEHFRCIKEAEPRATISICSSHAMYGTPEEDSKYQALFDELEVMDGVELKGSLNQTELYQEYAKASIFFYPCIWPETYCMAMDEAIAHGCWPVVSGLGALRERVAACVDEVSCISATVQYMELISSGITDDCISDKPKPWDEVAQQWERLF